MKHDQRQKDIRHVTYKQNCSFRTKLATKMLTTPAFFPCVRIISPEYQSNSRMARILYFFLQARNMLAAVAITLAHAGGCARKGLLTASFAESGAARGEMS